MLYDRKAAAAQTPNRQLSDNQWTAIQTHLGLPAERVVILNKSPRNISKPLNGASASKRGRPKTLMLPNNFGPTPSPARELLWHATVASKTLCPKTIWTDVRPRSH
jgi:hypothetical protein